MADRISIEDWIQIPRRGMGWVTLAGFHPAVCLSDAALAREWAAGRYAENQRPIRIRVNGRVTWQEGEPA